MSEFDFIPDKNGFHLDVFYVGEKPRYQINLLKMDCTCMGFTIEQAKAKNENRKPNNCKHLEEVRFRLRHSGIKLGRFRIKEAIG